MSTTAVRVRSRLDAALIDYDGDVEELIRRADAGEPCVVKGPAAIVWQIRQIIDEERKVARP